MSLEPPPQKTDLDYIWRNWLFLVWRYLTKKGLDLQATSTVIKVDDDSTAGNTRLYLYDVDNGQLERVSVGAADSGGAGYKVLRIPN